MTNKEAIRVFDTLKTTIKNQPLYVYEALDLAYAALMKIDLIKFNVHALNELLKEENKGGNTNV